MKRQVAFMLVAAGGMVLPGAAGDVAPAGTGVEVPTVEVMRLPDGGVQPQVVQRGDGRVDIVYLKGDAPSCDVFVMSSGDDGRTFASPRRVNSTFGSAVAAGTIRGAHAALGRDGRMHVVWNGSSAAYPGDMHAGGPLLYARSQEDSNGFSDERVIARNGLDGGASVAADDAGRVYVIWHGPAAGKSAEGSRRIWLAKSEDDGESFAQPIAIDGDPMGACACCAVRAFADAAGRVFVLYRTAKNLSERNMMLLVSDDRGRTFNQILIDEWIIGQCVMSSGSFVQTSEEAVLGAWETKRRVRFADITPGSEPLEITEPSQGENGKHPTIAANSAGFILLAWTEDTGWAQGGTVAWQVFDADAKTIEGASGRAPRLPVWGSVAAFAREDGSFLIVY